MSKHTPGPWRTDPDAEHMCVLSRTGRLIADCAIFGPDDPEQAELEDNARLISAAPDLLAALKQIIENDDFKGHRPASYAQACTAITKAEGLA